MLEIIAIICFCKKVASIANEKGRSAIGWVALTVLLWFMGEIAGAFAGIIIFGMEGEGFNLMVYVAALVGAICGGISSIVIAKQLPAVAW